MSREGAVVRNISAALDLRSNEVHAPGDRIRVNLNVQNGGNVEVSGVTLRLPFDNNRLTFFTHSVDAARGDQFVGVPGNTRVELVVGRIPAGQTAQVVVWFNVSQRAQSGNRIVLRAVSILDGVQRQTNEVSFLLPILATMAFVACFAVSTAECRSTRTDPGSAHWSPSAVIVFCQANDS